MKLRHLILSVVVLAVLSAVVFFVRRPGPAPSEDSRLHQPLVDRATVEKAAKLRISDQGKTVTLVRQSDGSWRNTSYYDLPADFAKLSGFIGNLTDAKIDRLVTSNPERIARLEFKDTKIEFLDSADKPLWSLTLGKTPDAGGGRFVRFGDEAKAYLASLSVWLDTEPKNWADSELLNLKPEDIAKLEVPFDAGSPVAFSRAKKEDPWTSDKTPAGQKVKADKISSTLGSIGSVRFSDTSNLDDPNLAAAKEHLRIFKLTTFDHKTIRVGLGRKPEEKKLKPPAPSTDGKTGPAALGSVADLKKDEKKEVETKSGEDKKATDDQKPLTPEYETIPAGPVFVIITNTDPDAPINALMQKRAFQVSDYIFTGLPQNPADFFEPAPPPPPQAAPKPEEKK
jgi:hypothetical protein